MKSLEKCIMECVYGLYNKANAPAWNIFDKKFSFSSFKELKEHMGDEFLYNLFYVTDGDIQNATYKYCEKMPHAWRYDHKLGISNETDGLFRWFAEAFVKLLKKGDYKHIYQLFPLAAKEADKKYAEQFAKEIRTYSKGMFENAIKKRNFVSCVFDFMNKTKFLIEIGGCEDIIATTIDMYEKRFIDSSVDSVFHKYAEEYKEINKMYENDRITEKEFSKIEDVIAYKYDCARVSIDKDYFLRMVHSLAPTTDIKHFMLLKKSYQDYKKYRDNGAEEEAIPTNSILKNNAESLGIEYFNEPYFKDMLKKAYDFEKSFEVE